MREARTFVNQRGRAQRGLITRDDLRGAGLAKHHRRTLVREGTLVRIGPRTFRHGVVELDHRGKALAAALDTGGVVSHRSAAWLHGLPGFGPGDPPEVLVANPRPHHRTPLARVHSTTWLPPDDRYEVDGIPCTSVARTLFGLAALVPEVPAADLRRAVDDAIRLGLASDQWLWWRLEKLRCRGRNGVTAFEAVLSARAGGAVTESWLEREFLRILAAAGVPLPRCQARIGPKGAFVARVDFLYASAAVIVEVTGAVGHSSPEQRAADARRRNGLSRAGFVILEFTYEQVVAAPQAVIAEVLGALAERRAA